MSKISAILPQTAVMIPDGSKVYLQNLKDYGSYIETSVGDYKEVEVEVGHVMHLLGIRGIDFWTDMIEIINLCKDGSSPHSKVWNLELFLEANPAILTEQVPAGIHNSENFDEEGVSLGQKIFSEWNDGGTQPIAENNDGTRVIIRTNISGVCVTQEEILIFNQFRIDNPGLNIDLLNSLQLQMLMGTEAYQQEEPV